MSRLLRLRHPGALTRMAAWVTRGRPAWLAGGVALAFVIVLSLRLLVSAGALTVRVTRDLEPGELRPERGHAFVVLRNVPDSDYAEPTSTLELLEDGRSLGPAHSAHVAIREEGAGGFSHWWGLVYLSSSDNSDPRTNGRTYALRYTWAPPNWLVIASLGGFLLLHGSALRRAARRAGAHPVALGAGLLLVAAAYRIWMIATAWQAPGDFDMVQGVPVSDAHGWEELSADFARGRRDSSFWEAWGARRPLYYLVLGSAYALLGESLWVPRLGQSLLGALATLLVFDALRRLAPLSVALVGALTHALLEYDARHALCTMTESLGYFLTNLALWALVLATARAIGAGRVSWARFAGAGALLALANLVRPLNLLAAAPLPLFAAVLWRRSARPARSWRAPTALVLAFVGGFLLVLTPWIARQHAVHGILTISDNTAESLYAAADPRHGGWTPAVSELARGTPGERVAFYERAFEERLSADPGFYLGNVWRHVLLNLGGVPVERWALLATCLAFALVWTGPRPGRGLTAALASAVLVVLFPDARLAWAWVPAGVLALFRVHPMGLLSLLLLATVAAMGLLATPPGDRLGYSQRWLATALACWGLWELLRGFAAGRRAGCEVPLLSGLAPPGWGHVGRLARGAALLATALLALGLARALTAAPGADARSAALAPEDGARWIERVVADERARPFRHLRDELVAVRATLRPEQTVRLRPGEPLQHWMQLLRPRAYEVTLLRTWPMHGAEFLVFPGRLPALDPSRRVVLIGVPRQRRGGSSLELVAIAPEPEAGEEATLHLAEAEDVALEHARHIDSIESPEDP